MSMSTMKASKTPAKAMPAKVPAKAMPAKVPAKIAPAKVPAKAPAKAAPARKKSSQEAMLARVEAVRLTQRQEGHFDCFGRAGEGYCDQGGCAFHSECLSVSRMLHAM